MSNYNTTIAQHNTELQDILTTVNELPDAGGSSETCTVTINFYQAVYPYLRYLAVINGETVLTTFDGDSAVTTITLTDVLVNSLLYCQSSTSNPIYSTTSGITAEMDNIFFNADNYTYAMRAHINLSAGESGSITITRNDSPGLPPPV